MWRRQRDRESSHRYFARVPAASDSDIGRTFVADRARNDEGSLHGRENRVKYELTSAARQDIIDNQALSRAIDAEPECRNRKRSRPPDPEKKAPRQPSGALSFRDRQAQELFT